MEPGTVVDHKSDNRWREGVVKCAASGDRVYVAWPENEDNGYAAYSPHTVNSLRFNEGQLSLF